jgi:hypothetical protein
VREHVQHDATTILGPVVPGRTLSGLPVALEHPVPKFAAHGEDLAEETGLDQPPQLAESGKEQLVGHHTGLHAGLGGKPDQLTCSGQVHGQRFLRVHVLAGPHRRGDGLLPALGGLRVEVDLHIVPGQRGGQVGGQVGQSVPLGDLGELGLVAADQHRLRPDPGAVGQPQAAVRPDGQQRPNEVLSVAHPAGHTVEHDADPPSVHGVPLGLMVEPSSSRILVVSAPNRGSVMVCA